jgi:aromatic-L-amino-acid decarboxylase
VLADLVTAGLGVQGMLWATSPACTELETHMLDWLVELCGLPDRFLSAGSGGGVIQDSASSSTLCALLAARERSGGAARLADLRVYGSSQAHSSLVKGARVAGFTDEAVRSIEVDDQYAMRPDLLADALRADAAAGAVPCLVTATVGTTSSTAIDPVPAIADVCADHGVWLHVDAAYAGSAAVCPELRFVNDGVDRADSYTFNPHKWLLTNFDCSAFYVADRQPLLETLGILPPYLRNAAAVRSDVIDYRNWHVPLGRRFRALKLWFVLRSYGAEGLRTMIREHVDLARLLADRLSGDSRFELIAPVPFGLVCFRHRGGNDATERLAAAINASGNAFLTPSHLGDLAFIRVAVGQGRTRRDHVDALWSLIDRLADDLG